MLEVGAEVAVMLVGMVAAALFSSATYRCFAHTEVRRWLPSVCQAVFIWTLIGAAIWSAGNGWHVLFGAVAATVGISGGLVMERHKSRHPEGGTR